MGGGKLAEINVIGLWRAGGWRKEGREARKEGGKEGREARRKRREGVMMTIVGKGRGSDMEGIG